MPPSSGPDSHLLRRLALTPSSLGVGLECCAWGEGPLGSQTHPSQQPGRGWLPESVCGGCQGRRTQAWGSGNGLMPPSVHAPVSATWAEGTPFQCKRPGHPRMVLPLPILGPKISTSRTGEMDPWLPAQARKETDPWANRRETKSGTRRRLRGGWTGRQIGRGVFGAWQTQGLIAGASLGAEPGTSSGEAGRRRGRPGPLPPRPPWVPASFQSFRQGSPGQRCASLSLPGHLGGVSPANGTRPVGLRGQPHIRLHPRLVRTQPRVEPGLLDADRDKQGRPPGLPPPSPHGVAGDALPSTTCRHTWCGTRGCRGALGAAAAPRSR